VFVGRRAHDAHIAAHLRRDRAARPQSLATARPHHQLHRPDHE
jgi:hypothetical protein